MNIKYRIATIEDVPKIKELTDVMLTHTKLGLATTEKITKLVQSPKTFFMLATDFNDIIGFVCGVAHESIFSDVRRVSDIGVFVLPEYRTTSIGIKLIKKLEEWAKTTGASQMWLGQTTGDSPDKTLKLYERLGYTLKGFNTMKEI